MLKKGEWLRRKNKIKIYDRITKQIHIPPADRHFFVTKELKGERTVTRVNVLEGDERIAEIARMLGGGKAAEEHAREMVGLKDL